MIHIPNDKGDFLLGLSLAELIMMLFFVLALLLMMAQQTSGDEKLQCGVDIRKLVDANNTLNTELALLREEVAYGETIDSKVSCSSRLVSLKRQVADEKKQRTAANSRASRLDQENERLSKLVKSSEATNGLLSSNGIEEEALRKLIESSKIEKSTEAQIVKLIQENSAASKQLEKLTDTNSELEHTIDKLNRELADAKAELESANDSNVLANLRQKLDESELENQACLGRIVEQRKRCGNDWPPCWAPVNGKTHYLLNIKINNDGYDIAPGWSQGTTEQAMKIDGISQLINGQISSSSFRREANKVLSWSKERRCRHYVRVYDTEDTNKAMYKDRLHTLENYFYKYEPNRF